MLKIDIKWPIKPISANCRSLVLLRISQKLTKIPEYSYKVLQVLLIFLNLETLNMPNNKHPRKDVNVARLLFKSLARLKISISRLILLQNLYAIYQNLS